MPAGVIKEVLQMSGRTAGFATDIVVGLAIGLGFGGRQKPWPELNDKENRLKIALIT
jgi:hypothetical protein